MKQETSLFSLLYLHKAGKCCVCLPTLWVFFFSFDIRPVLHFIYVVVSRGLLFCRHNSSSCHAFMSAASIEIMWKFVMLLHIPVLNWRHCLATPAAKIYLARYSEKSCILHKAVLVLSTACILYSLFFRPAWLCFQCGEKITWLTSEAFLVSCHIICSKLPGFFSCIMCIYLFMRLQAWMVSLAACSPILIRLSILP